MIFLSKHWVWDCEEYFVSEISGSHGGEYEGNSRLGYCAM
jgi:hypothetical protein